MCDLTKVTIDPDQVWRAVETRDARFDGWVFCGVRTTGIYCRPSCPGRPKRENVSFFASPAQAREAGLRACKRCRPDEVPVSMFLPAREPFAGDALVEFLARRAIPGVEEVTDGVYRRSLRLEHGLGTVELEPAGDHV